MNNLIQRVALGMIISLFVGQWVMANEPSILPSADCDNPAVEKWLEDECKSSEQRLLTDREWQLRSLHKLFEGDNEKFTLARELVDGTYSIVMNKCNALPHNDRAYCMNSGYRQKLSNHEIEERIDNLLRPPPSTTTTDSPASMEDIRHEYAAEHEKAAVPENVIFPQAIKNNVPRPNPVSSGDEVVVEETTGSESSNSRERNSNRGEYIFLFIFIGLTLALLALPVIIFFGATKQIVVFFDAKDLGWCLLPLPIIATAGYAFPTMNDGWFEIIIRFLMSVTMMLIGFYLWRKCVIQAVTQNRGSGGGVVIGIMKPLVAGLAVIGLFGNYAKMTNTNLNRAERSSGALMIVIWLWIGRTLINGHDVYQERGWSLNEKTHEPLDHEEPGELTKS